MARAPDNPSRGGLSLWRIRVAIAAVLLSALAMLAAFVAYLPSESSSNYQHSSPPVVTSGGGAACPDPSFLLNPSIHDPPPDIGWVSSDYFYSGECYHFVAYTPYSTGAPLGGAKVNVSIWPATGPGSLGSPPPANFTCGSSAARPDPDVCVYVPPPTYWAEGLTGSDGTIQLTVGMPIANYSAEVWEWIDGTESAG